MCEASVPTRREMWWTSFSISPVVQGYSEVRVVHGKGTGTLRSVLREMLTGHPHVAEFRTAEPERGGDGVTVVTLRTGG